MMSLTLYLHKASLGNIQQKFKLLDQSGTELTGELDRLFYERLLDEDEIE